MNTVEKVAECDSWTPVLKVVINRDTILPLSHVQRMELLAEREEKRVWKLGSKREAVWHRDLCRLKEIQVSENVTKRYLLLPIGTLDSLNPYRVVAYCDNVALNAPIQNHKHSSNSTHEHYNLCK